MVSTSTASEKLMVRLMTSPMVYVPSAVVVFIGATGVAAVLRKKWVLP